MGQIKVEKNVGGIEGLCVITPAVHGDNRGYFMETYSQRDMEEAGLFYNFVQDNQSSSVKGVLRGLHFQIQYPQTKLVRVIKGSVFDVAVDLRPGSATYGKYFGSELTEENKKSPLTAPNFCMLLRKHIQNGKILDITQPGLERIMRIEIEHLDEMGDLRHKTLLIEAMGKHSNIIFIEENSTRCWHLKTT